MPDFPLSHSLSFGKILIFEEAKIIASSYSMAFIKSFSIQADQQHPFPFNIPAVRFARGIALGDQVTIFVGDNGCGKSTLLESLAYAIDIPLIGGRIGGASPSFAAAKMKIGRASCRERV